MKIKIIILTIFIAFFIIGGTLYVTSKDNNKIQVSSKNYILVKFQGEVEYKEYLTIKKGTELKILLDMVNAKNVGTENKIYIKSGST